MLNWQSRAPQDPGSEVSLALLWLHGSKVPQGMSELKPTRVCTLALGHPLGTWLRQLRTCQSVPSRALLAACQLSLKVRPPQAGAKGQWGRWPEWAQALGGERKPSKLGGTGANPQGFGPVAASSKELISWRKTASCTGGGWRWCREPGGLSLTSVLRLE